MAVINKNLLPIKAHYFFFYGAMGGAIPFMPVLAKGLGISATAVGLIYTVLPFFVFISKPFFGFLTDHFKNVKAILLVMVITVAFAFLMVLRIPSIPGVIYLQCTESNLTTNMTLKYNKACFVDNIQYGLSIEFNDSLCNSSCGQDCNETYANITAVSTDGDYLDHLALTNATNSSVRFIDGRLLLMEIQNYGFSSVCSCIKQHPSSVIVQSHLESCKSESEIDDSMAVYSSYQFWVFTLLAVIGGTGSATIFCLTDAACYEVLGDKPCLYGRQRLWATISWGLVTLVTGYLNDWATGGAKQQNYAPGINLMACLVVVDLLILLKVTLTKASISKNICKDVGRVFSSTMMVAFATGVLIMGALTGLLWNYQFWYLQDMGADQTLLGIAVAIQCLLAEVPCFVFAGWLIKRFGHFYCLSASFAAYALRYGLYFMLENPWLTLPIEILHGITFALFYAVMTSYASENAPPGTEATTLGVLGGLFEGLGLAVGSLLGGIGFDKLGGRNTFLTAAIISLLCAPSFAIIQVLHKMSRPRRLRSAPL